MKKSKIAAGVLLLAMGLSPVNSGLSYAEEAVDSQVETGVEEDANKESNDELIKKTNEESNTETEDITDDDKNSKNIENELEISEDKKVESQQANDVLPIAEDFSMEDFINGKVSEIEATKLYKIATDDELTAFKTNIENLKSESKDFDEEKSEQVANKIEEYSKDLGRTVVFAKPYRTRLRILSKIADNKLAKEKDENLDKANKEAKDLIYAKNTSLESLSNAGQKLLDLIGTYKLDAESLNEIYKLDGYPGVLVESFTEEDYKRGLDELEIEKEAYLEDANRYADLLKQLTEGEQLVENQAEIAKKYKNAVEELRNASGEESINEKINALTDPAYKMDNMVLEYNKKVKGKDETEEKLLKDIEKALDDKDFKENEAYKRTSAEKKGKYEEAYRKLKENKTSENLKALNDIKEEIKTNTFEAKLAQLRSLINNPDEVSVSETKLKEIQEKYLKMLDDIKEDDTKTLDALNDFEKDVLPKFYEEVNESSTPKRTPVKQKRKVVTKKSKGKVRTGIESVLPIAGGVAVIAAIALFLTRKKK